MPNPNLQKLIMKTSVAVEYLPFKRGIRKRKCRLTMICQPSAEKCNHDLKIEVKSNLGFFLGGGELFLVFLHIISAITESIVRTVCFPLTCLETRKEQTKLTAQFAARIVTHTVCLILLHWYLFPADERRRRTGLK